MLVCNAVTTPDPVAATIDLLAGADQVTVDSGIFSGGFRGGAGVKSLTFKGGVIGGYVNTTGVTNVVLPTGSTALVGAAMSFGAGADRLEIHGGELVGHVEQGDGADAFVMSGGKMASLDQGGNLDTAEVSGGWIVGAFNDGDIFNMTGGRIGSVDLRVADNQMRMSGGSIDGRVNAEQGRDLLVLTGGVIGGQVDFGNGDNTFEISGGQIGGGIVSGRGADSLTWDSGGVVLGVISLGEGDDVATLRNLTTGSVSDLTALGGQVGSDRLTFDQTEMSGLARFDGWENVALTNGSRLTMDADFVLGDAGTGTGSLMLDATSAIFASASGGSIRPFSAGRMASVTNAGTIDLSTGAAGPAARLTIVGDYVGEGGRLIVRSVLEGDGAPSDRLIISGGVASGTTAVNVINAGGRGALTNASGIMVVEAINGASTAPSAFNLAGGSVSAGAYEYYLFRGGVGAGTADNWYLRSTLLPGSAPPAAAVPRAATPPPPPPGEAPDPGPAEPQPQLASPAPPAPPPAGAQPVQLYRVETPVYAATPAIARSLGLTMLDTFHERQGEQDVLEGDGGAPAGWGRLIGQSTRQKWSGDARPDFHGETLGFQTGLDLFGTQSESGRRNRLGFFIGYARSQGDVAGFAAGWEDLHVGKQDVDATSVGLYWTHVAPNRAYLDAVAIGAWYDVKSRSARGLGMDTEGDGLTLSLEGGYPLRVGGLTIEPQAQVIWQQLSFDEGEDLISTVAYEDSETTTGRIGARFYGTFAAGETELMPYAKVNLWKDFSGSDKLIFDGADRIVTDHQSTALELGAGLTARVSTAVSLFAVADYTHGLDSGRERRTLEANFGARWTW